MRKLLNLLSLLTITGASLSSVTACSGFNPNVNPNPNPPNPPVTHDITYYQKKIKDLTNQVTQIQSDINDMNSKTMKEQVCGSNTMCKELQELIDSSTCELKQYQATIQDDQYQIMVLKTNGNFNPQEKLQVIKYLQSELTLLTEKRLLMLKVPDYSKSDFDNVDKQILLINSELAKLIPPKEVDNKC